MKRHYYLLIAVAIAIGVLLRIYPLIGHSFYPGFDSPWYVYSTILYESLGQVPDTEVHVQGGGRPYVSDPLHIVLFTQFRILLGLEPWDAMRILSPIFPVLIGIGLFLWTRKIFSHSPSRDFISLLVLVIFFVGFSDIRALYPRLKQEMGMALMVFAVPFLASFISTGRRTSLWIGGVMALGLALTHLLVWGMFVISMLLGLFLIHVTRGKTGWTRSLLVLGIIGALTGLIIFGRIEYTEDFLFGAGAAFSSIPFTRLAFLPEYYMPALWLFAAIGGAFATASILRRNNLGNSDPVQAVLLSASILVALVLTISELLPITILPHRFIIILNVLLSIPAGYGLFALGKSFARVRVRWDAVRKVLVVLAVAILAFASYSYALLEPQRIRVTTDQATMRALDWYSTVSGDEASSLTTARVTFWALAFAGHDVIWADNRMEFPEYVRRATLATLIFYYACKEDIPALVGELEMEFTPIFLLLPARDRVHTSNTTAAPLISFDRFVDVIPFMHVYDNGALRVIYPGETENFALSSEPGCEAARLSPYLALTPP